MKSVNSANHVFLQEDFFGLDRGLLLRLISDNGSLYYEPLQKITPTERYDYDELKYICSTLHPDDLLHKSAKPISNINLKLTSSDDKVPLTYRYNIGNWPNCSIDFETTVTNTMDTAALSREIQDVIDAVIDKVKTLSENKEITCRFEYIVKDFLGDRLRIQINGQGLVLPPIESI